MPHPLERTAPPRRRIAFDLAIASLIGFVTFLTAAAGASPAWAADDPRFTTELLPLLETYCYDCHDADSDVPLGRDATLTDMRSHRDVWNRAIDQIRLGTMPPADGEMLEANDRESLAKLIDSLANAIDCVRNPNAGRVTLRRLNRAEYRNTIRDLTGVDYEPADGFPGDDVGYGFDNIGDVLSLPPILMEKYLNAAEAIVGRAIDTPPPPRRLVIDRRPESLIGADKYSARDGSLNIGSNGAVTLQVDLEFGGAFDVVVTASGDQAGGDPVMMRVGSGGQERVIAVPSDDPEDYVVPLRLGKGTRQIEIAFTNDFYNADTKADRNLRLHHVRLEGDEKRSAFERRRRPRSHDALVFVRPGGDVGEDAATRRVMSRFASRAFRRPAVGSEIDRLATLAAEVRDDGGTFDESIQVAMSAVLCSPHFLFKVERPRTPEIVDGRLTGEPMPRVSDYELATRLSYFLWSSMPDDELLLLAHRGQLRRREVLMKKVAAMLRDPRANRFVENFAGQWLMLRNLDVVDPDRRLFRTYDGQINRLMRRETLTFFAAVMRENLPATALLDADFTFLNERLAKYYNVRGVEGNQFRRVSLDGTPRGGLLTHASVLTVTSNPTRTSPVKRGKFILENVLGTPPPPAPPGIPELDRDQLTGSLRERMRQHREDPACASCHATMDPLGFALENFDAVGRYRTREGVHRIDASGELPDGTRLDGLDGLRRLLTDERREQFVQCLTEKMLTYAIGRGIEYYDRCAVDKIVAGARRHDYRFAYLVAGIVASDPFQKQGVREGDLGI